ncbi:MAG: hypothetical protein LIO90_07295 [Bacteroidales bacterium]|nr:hypothetical protein [Bacteroidales bacterium]
MKKTLLSLTIPLVLVGCSSSFESPEKAGELQSRGAEKTLAWEYPEVIHDSLETHAEMVASYQIPQEVLESLSTPDLLQVCMSYPLLFDALAYDDFSRGTSIVMKQCNGFKALTARKDAAEAYLSYLNDKLEVLQGLEKLSLIERGNATLSLAIFELVLSTPDAQASLSTSDLKALKEMAGQIWHEKYLHPQDISWMPFCVSGYLCYTLDLRLKGMKAEESDFPFLTFLQNTPLIEDLFISTK